MGAAARRHDTGAASGADEKARRSSGLGSNYPLWRLDSLGKFRPPARAGIAFRFVLSVLSNEFRGSGCGRIVRTGDRHCADIVRPLRACGAPRFRIVNQRDDLDQQQTTAPAPTGKASSPSPPRCRRLLVRCRVACIGNDRWAERAGRGKRPRHDVARPKRSRHGAIRDRQRWNGSESVVAVVAAVAAVVAVVLTRRCR